MEIAAGTLDAIIDTVSANHSLVPLVNLLKVEGKLVLLGAPPTLEVPIFPLVTERQAIIGSSTGGLKETQEMLDFAAERNILPDVEIISMDFEYGDGTSSLVGCQVPIRH